MRCGHSDEGQRVASLDDYAALARHLNGLYRTEQRSAAEDAQRRDTLAAGIAQLGARLVAQYQRLAGIAQNIGQDLPVPPPGLPPAPVVHPDGPATYLPPHQRSAPGATPPPRPPDAAGSASAPSPPVSGVPVAPAQRTGPDQPDWAQPAHQPSYPAAPGNRPTGPELPTGANRLALPATTGIPTGAAAGPHPPAAPIAPAPPADPARELDLARQAADAADNAAFEAETAAQRAPLLPSATPFQRAIFVYALCAVTLAVFQWILLVTSNITELDPTAWIAWSCAGLPTVAFFVGYLILSVWGKPRIVVGVPARYARLGFLICFLSSPLAFCGYVAVTRL